RRWCSSSRWRTARSGTTSACATRLPRAGCGAWRAAWKRGGTGSATRRWAQCPHEQALGGICRLERSRLSAMLPRTLPDRHLERNERGAPTGIAAGKCRWLPAIPTSRRHEHSAARRAIPAPRGPCDCEVEEMAEPCSHLSALDELKAGGEVCEDC